MRFEFEKASLPERRDHPGLQLGTSSDLSPGRSGAEVHRLHDVLQPLEDEEGMAQSFECVVSERRLRGSGFDLVPIDSR